ncbi:chalcone isomerase family protein [Limnobacter parvus]|uniref:Chalcone isomerase family protein n=1 Tax=Limnobacter parvus TaxID=2939690 RepID=A0ABT1XHT0_9BURK|nr:chalcone isomerase family protein [Limnobacter parvus]MCR2745624.1 chalcone isomerase family protein [Limnobacter parvus]
MKFYTARMIQRALLCAALLGLSPMAVASDNLNPPPKQVTQTIENAKRMGHGTLRWFGLRVYDGQLWSNAEPEGFNYKRDPAWLELRYARDFDGSDIAERTIEEMEAIGAGTEVQRQGWLVKLTEIFPDVKKGHTLSALSTPGKGMQFYRNGLPLAKIDDPELAEAFMGIWLDPKTSAPEMRRELIGLKR